MLVGVEQANKVHGKSNNRQILQTKVSNIEFGVEN